MIKKIRVTVDGKPYDVTVEIPDEPPAATCRPRRRRNRGAARRQRPRLPPRLSPAAGPGTCPVRSPAMLLPSPSPSARAPAGRSVRDHRSHENEHLRPGARGRQSRRHQRESRRRCQREPGPCASNNWSCRHALFFSQTDRRRSRRANPERTNRRLQRFHPRRRAQGSSQGPRRPRRRLAQRRRSPFASAS